MENVLVKNNKKLNKVFDNIKELIINSRNRVYSVVNIGMLNLYWNIGKIIMEIQEEDVKVSYNDEVLEKLSIKLTEEFGKGFSSKNLRTMRKFYIYYPIWKTVSSKLSWYHYLELIKIDEEKIIYFFQLRQRCRRN